MVLCNQKINIIKHLTGDFCICSGLRYLNRHATMHCLPQVTCCVHATNIECTMAIFTQCHKVLIENCTIVSGCDGCHNSTPL